MYFLKSIAKLLVRPTLATYTRLSRSGQFLCSVAQLGLKGKKRKGKGF
jgi:hypothetical protein